MDICRGGKRINEYLKLYLVEEHTKDDRRKNAATLKLAEAMRSKRVVEIQSMDFGVDVNRGSDVLFYDFVRDLINRKEGTTRVSWRNCLAHLLRYEPNEQITIGQITPQWVRGFRNYLESEATQWAIDSRKRSVTPKLLSAGTRALMFQKLCTVFNVAIREGVIQVNPTANVERFREPESKREYLTIEDLRRLRRVPPPSELLGRAFFFSCLTGLRWSDIVELRWSEVQTMGGVTRLVFKQKKTGGLEYLDLNQQAVELMGQPRGADDCVFADLGPLQAARIGVSAWVRSAGIDKHITFHCARHTFCGDDA